VFRGKAITISCTDLTRSVAFYQGVLGAVPIRRDGDGCPWYRLGDIVFSLIANAQATTPASFPRDAMVTMWLEVNDLVAAHRRLVDAGVRIVERPEGGPYVLIADPDGLLIEVWEREDDAASRG
jgi:catechol 2,3-dioxygenase-like lactoylglutathione lyase family enzyme